MVGKVERFFGQNRNNNEKKKSTTISWLPDIITRTKRKLLELTECTRRLQ